jgi:phospholipid transport system substrate-binding protein
MAARLLACVVALIAGLALAADPPSSDPSAGVKKTLEAALAIARAGGDRDQNLAALHNVARDILDTRTMGRRAMGEVLAAQPQAQQDEYLQLFDELMVRAYLSKLLLFRNPKFSYDEPRRNGDVAIVPTRIETSKDEYKVDYEMRQHDGRWVATDVIVEGISLTRSYKDQFESVLKGRSFSELLDLMRAKVKPAEKTS